MQQKIIEAMRLICIEAPDIDILEPEVLGDRVDFTFLLNNELHVISRAMEETAEKMAHGVAECYKLLRE